MLLIQSKPNPKASSVGLCYDKPAIQKNAH